MKLKNVKFFKQDKMSFADTILYNIWNIFVEGKRNERFSDLKNLVPEFTGNSEYADRDQDDSYVVEKRLGLTDSAFLLSRFLDIIGQDDIFPVYSWKNIDRLTLHISLLETYLSIAEKKFFREQEAWAFEKEKEEEKLENTEFPLTLCEKTIGIDGSPGYNFYTIPIKSTVIEADVKKMAGFIRIHDLYDDTYEDVDYDHIVSLKFSYQDNGDMKIVLFMYRDNNSDCEYTFCYMKDLTGRGYLVGMSSYIPNCTGHNYNNYNNYNSHSVFILDMRLKLTLPK